MQHLLRKDWTKAEVARMNGRQIVLIQAVQEMIGGTLDLYDQDPTHAPAKWLLENWWNTLEVALTSSDHVEDPSIETKSLSES